MAVSGIRQGDLLGLLTNTLPKYPFPDFFQTFDFYAYPIMARTLAKRRRSDGGKSINWHASLDGQGTAEFTRPHSEDSTQARDTTIEFAEKMSFFQAHYLVDARELALNGGAAKIVSTLADRRGGAMKDLANLIERAGLFPQQSSTDDLRPRGIMGYIVPGPTGAYDDGFVGQTCRYSTHTSGTAVTGTTIAGQDRSSADRAKLRNYAGIYDKIDQAFLKRFRLATKKTSIMAPPIVNDGTVVSKSDEAILMPTEQWAQLQDQLDARNSNAGRDMAVSKSGATSYIENIPVIPSPILDPESSTDTDYYRAYVKPILCVNFAAFDWWYIQDFWMKESDPIKPDRNHNAAKVFVDCSGQWSCKHSKYAGFMFHKQLTF